MARGLAAAPDDFSFSPGLVYLQTGSLGPTPRPVMDRPPGCTVRNADGGTLLKGEFLRQPMHPRDFAERKPGVCAAEGARSINPIPRLPLAHASPDGLEPVAFANGGFANGGGSAFKNGGGGGAL